ncbi:zf-HC2 domain-containing protein [Bacillaceae bacterium W0354]
MSCEEKISSMIHQYFDNELSTNDETQLKHHLMECSDCQQHFREIKQVHENISKLEPVQVPDNLKENIMNQLPKDSKAKKYTKLLKEHPFITAAAVFFVLLLTSTLTQYYNDEHLYLTQHEGVITEGNVVIIPEGEVIEGDFLVKNADVIIRGQIKGDLTLINSKIIDENNSQYSFNQTYAHSNVDGEINIIDRYASWVFYKFQSGFDQIKSLLDF